ncbi:toxin-antitoxin system, antitoxin component, Xre family protein [Aphanothece hegewaldii CCALA 016]|uniref:Toxin-antitoxin system, antitoxin component, Xre family protein n=1 Tax=Aphanothece hegewaldii CCALA 016 TaxID=2107694 RepID=A0A2T1LQH9_9CHRO|nr:toxin-antitoxin system, antitoxin component, Xre family protein [Aphanothece hegewaldii]PSF27850.1 toxin-antitoxin system, antitoxin component, Xre family protein [Aphanothece hegewaldii CCALA 016]
MKNHYAAENRLLEKVQKLSVEQIQQLEQFIDSLNQQEIEQPLTIVSTKLSEPVFSRIWNNPEDAVYDNL